MNSTERAQSLNKHNYMLTWYNLKSHISMLVSRTNEMCDLSHVKNKIKNALSRTPFIGIVFYTHNRGSKFVLPANISFMW